jgi:hypothetical protein
MPEKANGSRARTDEVLMITGGVDELLAEARRRGVNAVASYSDTLRVELSPLGIKVVTLFMGEVSTNLISPDSISFSCYFWHGFDSTP